MNCLKIRFKTHNKTLKLTLDCALLLLPLQSVAVKRSLAWRYVSRYTGEMN